MNLKIISLERFDEELSHTIRLRRSHWREARLKADRL
jgi:hypothetical protein